MGALCCPILSKSPDQPVPCALALLRHPSGVQHVDRGVERGERCEQR